MAWHRFIVVKESQWSAPTKEHPSRMERTVSHAVLINMDHIISVAPTDDPRYVNLVHSAFNEQLAHTSTCVEMAWHEAEVLLLL